MEQKNMLPGLTREAEEQKLQEIIGIAQLSGLHSKILNAPEQISGK